MIVPQHDQRVAAIILGYVFGGYPDPPPPHQPHPLWAVLGVSCLFFLAQGAYFFPCKLSVKKKAENVWHATYAFFCDATST